ncbi:hypothetical protein FB639_006184 [Coemansia asiatica]|nr:hypothetical protein FB639_006184 [Coemansia asiatica]
MVCTICYEPLFKDQGNNNNNNNNNNNRGYRKNNKMPAALSCGHVFHTNCINRWLYSQGNYACPLCNQEPFEQPLRLYMELDEKDAMSIMSNSGIDHMVAQLGGISISGVYGSLADDYDHICEMQKIDKVEEENRKLKEELNAKNNVENGLRSEISRMNFLSEKHRENIRGMQFSIRRKNERINQLEYELYGSDDDDDDDDDDDEDDDYESDGNYYYY